MNLPLISVVMTVYNEENFLKDSISSVLNQTYTNLQFIIIDDGSTDQSADVIKGFQDSRIEYHKLPQNSHISYATNIGFQKVRGAYLAIMDSDDIWMPDKLEIQLNFLMQNPQYKGCFSWVDLIDENGNSLNETLLELKNLFSAQTMTREKWLDFFFFQGNRLNNPSSLVESSVLETLGGHNLFYIQATDMEWWVRFTLHYSFAIIEKPLLKYRRAFDTTINVSSNSEKNNTRFYNEMMHIRKHLLDEIPDDLFIRTFHKYFQNSSSSSSEELICEKAFLLMRPYNGSTCFSALGLSRMEELLSDNQYSEVLKSKFYFSTKECGKYTGEHIYYDPLLQTQERTAADKISQLNSQCQQQEKHVEHLENELLAYGAHAEALQSQILEYQKTVDILNQTLEDQQSHIRLLEESLEQIVHSNAWKITAPLRKCKDVFSKKNS